MDLTNEEISNSSNSDLYLSLLLKNTPEEKAGVLRDYRKRISQNKKHEDALLHQNNDVLIAIKNLVDSSNEIQISISLEIENILLSELESSQQKIDTQKNLINSLEKQLIQKRETEKSVVQSIRKFKQDHQTQLTRLSASHEAELAELSASHQKALTNLSVSHQEEIKAITEKEKSPLETINSTPIASEQVASLAEANDERYYKLIAWPNFNELTNGDGIIPLATRLMAQQMSLAQMQHFLGGETEKERLLLFIDELSSIGLLVNTNIKEEANITNHKPEKNNRLQLFQRIRSSLGI